MYNLWKRSSRRWNENVIVSKDVTGDGVTFLVRSWHFNEDKCRVSSEDEGSNC